MDRRHGVKRFFAVVMIALCLPLAGCSTSALSAGPSTGSKETVVSQDDGQKNKPSEKQENSKQGNSTIDKTPTPDPAIEGKPKTSDEIHKEVDSLSPAATMSAWNTTTGYLNVPHSDMKSVYVGCSPKAPYTGREWQIAADGSWLRSEEKDIHSESSPFAANNPGIPEFLLSSCLANFAGMPDAAIEFVRANDMDGKWHSVSWEGHEFLFTGTATSYDFVLK